MRISRETAMDAVFCMTLACLVLVFAMYVGELEDNRGLVRDNAGLRADNAELWKTLSQARPDRPVRKVPRSDPCGLPFEERPVSCLKGE